MTVTDLTDARTGALVPRKTPYERRDGRLRGFGVRVTPSGRKLFFVHCQHGGERVWKTVGDFGAIGVDEARSRAAGMLAAIRRGEPVPARPEETLFEAVAETVFRQHERLWKPRTLAVNRCYLGNQILPCFGGRQVAEIDRADVRKWFASLRATPVAADRLLILSGCRKSEILTLRWDDIDRVASELRLRDAKSGPRMVPLTPPMVKVLDGIDRPDGNPWVIPGRRPNTRLVNLDYYWKRVAAEAGLKDVRLHDTRHSYASRALALGESLSLIGRLLGHSRVATTARYAHLVRDAEKAAAGRVGESIGAHVVRERRAA